uniref:Uncharacterized protein n=1 Tax=Meloidogyne javanica TaxID=6303 RepID=A0A915M4D4_MELJA
MFEPTFEFPVKVQLLSWNEKMEQDCCELLSEEEIAKSAGEAGEKPICLMQIYVALPSNRSNIPVIIILAGTFVSEHNSPITDIASCSFDLITVSGDVGVFCGNLLGQISVYSATSGALLAEVNAHFRQITALAVATESAYIIEFRYGQRFDNMPIVGANFANTRGSGYLVSFYENFKILLFKITRPNRPISEVTINTALE